MSLPKIKFISAMLIFGTIGLFVRWIDLPSSMIALVRGVIGSVFLLLVMAGSGRKLSWAAVRRNARWLIPSGIAIGINWILLFESYRYTTVSIATLCYYLAPVFVMALSPAILKEPLTARRVCCILAAFAGMLLISGLVPIGSDSAGNQAGDLLSSAAFSDTGRNTIGILLGIGAAAFYAGVMLMNKFLKEISSYDTTVIQLASAALILLPYTCLTENIGAVSWAWETAGLLIIIGVIHTGFAYWIYFSSMKDLPGQTIALLSYIDPATAILLSVFVLGETMNLTNVIGAVLILGAAMAGERRC